MDVQMRLGQQLLQLGVLALQIMQPRRPADLQPAELGSLLVEGRFAEAPLRAKVLHWQSDRGLVQEPNHLLFCELALSHVRHPSVGRTRSRLGRYRWKGASHNLEHLI